METSSTRVSSTRASSFTFSLMGNLRWFTLDERGVTAPAGRRGQRIEGIGTGCRKARIAVDARPFGRACMLAPMTTDHVLLHLCTPPERVSYELAGEIAPASLGEVGFVHLSTPEQVALPAQRLFAGRDDLQLLVLDPAALERAGVEVRWEPGVPGDPDAMRFPHAYGAVPTAAVVDVVAYPPGPDGYEAPELR